MKPGTPGFSADRLKEAREARGLTASALSERVGVTRQAVSQYETGVVTPGPDVLQSISSALDLPTAYFLRPGPEPEAAPIFFRSLTKASKGFRVRGTRRYQWLFEIVQHIRRFVELPTVNLPQFDAPTDPKLISNEMIEIVATETRRFWGLGDGPISNVVWLLENNGVIIARDTFGTENIDAFSVVSSRDDTPYVVLGNDKTAAARSRLDVAHELGHIILHRNLDPSIPNLESFHALIEQQAFRFAGAFLLPSKTFTPNRYVVSLDALRTLKPTWLVSIGAMIKRAEDLEYINRTQARKLWISYSRRGWKKHEPFDDEIPLEQPRVLRRALELIFGEGIEAPSDILSTAVPIAPGDIAELVGLSPHHFMDASPTITVMPTRRTQDLGTFRRSGNIGEIIKFPKPNS